MSGQYKPRLKIKLCRDCCEEITGKPGTRCSRCAKAHIDAMKSEYARKQSQERREERQLQVEVAKAKKREEDAAFRRHGEMWKHPWNPQEEGIDEWWARVSGKKAVQRREE
jgi:hypothetical protein